MPSDPIPPHDIVIAGELIVGAIAIAATLLLASWFPPRPRSIKLKKRKRWWEE